MKKTKKILACLTTTAMLITSISLPMAQAEPEDYPILYENDFSNDMTGLTPLIRTGQAYNTVKIENEKLVLSNGGWASVVVDGSENWTDFEVEADMTWDKSGTYTGGSTKTGYGRFVFRGDNSNGNDSWFAMYSSKYSGYEFANTQIQMFTSGATNLKDVSAWHSVMSTTAHLKTSLVGNKLTTVGDFVENGEKTQKTMVGEVTADNGIFALATASGGCIHFDNLVIRDLSATAQISGKTTDVVAGDTMTLTFSEDMNYESLADKVVFTDGVNETAAVIAKVDNKTITVAVPEGLEKGVEYTLVVKRTATDAEGTAMCEDRKFTVTTKAGIQNAILYQNDFSSTDLSDFDITLNSGDTAVVENEKLALTGGSVIAALKGSENWTDYEIEVDIQCTDYDTAKQNYGWLYVRADKSNISGTGSRIGYQFADTQMILYAGTNSEIYTDQKAIKNPAHTKGVVTGKDIIVTGKWNDVTKSLSGESKDGRLNGLIALANVYGGAVTYDNLVIRDLSATAEIVGNTTDLITGDTVDLVFTENMNFDSMAGKVVFTDGVTEIPASFTNNGADTITVTVPELATGAEYTLLVKKSATDAQGTAMNLDREFTITTKASEFNCISTSPVTGSKNVHPLEDVVLTFDKNVDYNDLSNIQLTLKDEENNTVDCEVSTVLSTANSLYIAIADKMQAGKKYTMSVRGVKSVDGDSLTGALTVSFETAEEAEEYLYYNDFTDGQMTGLSIVDNTAANYTNGEHDKNYYVQDGKLYIQLNDAIVGSDSIIATIDGSDSWADYEVSIDMTLGGGFKYPRVWTRGGSGEGYKAAFTIVNASSEHSFKPFDSAAVPTNPSWISGDRNLTIKVVGDKMSYKLGDTVLYDNETIPEAELKKSGAIAFGMEWSGTVAFDNIIVRDLGMKYTVGRYKNYVDGDIIEVTFDTAMNQDSLDTLNVEVTDSEGDMLNVQAYPISDTKMGIKLPDGLKSKEIYTVRLKKDITSATGIAMSTDKIFEIKSSVKEVDVTGLSLVNSAGEVKKLTTGDVVKGYASITNNSAAKQDFTIIMAIYDNDVLLDVIDTHKVLEAKTSDVIETTSYTVADKENLTVRVMMVDTLDAIKPLTASAYYTK